jgi:MFS family permease
MEASSVPHRRNVALYYAYSFLTQFLLWGAIWIKYLIDDRGLELKYILYMDLPFWLLVAALQAPMGALADRLGRKRVLALSGVLYALTILGFGFATNYWLLFFDYVLWAFAMSSYMGADQALIYDTLKLAGRESDFKKVAGRGFALGMLAALAGVGLGGVLAHYTSLTFTVQISALMPLLSVAVACFMWEPPIQQADRHYWADLRGAVTFAWRVPQVRYSLLVGSVLLTGTFGPVVLVQPFLLEHNVGDVMFGWLQAPLRLTSVVASLVAAGIGLRMGIPRVLVLGGLFILLSYLGLALIGSTAAFAFFALPALVQGVSNPLVANHLNERIPSAQRATVLSVMQLAFALQVAFFEPALGFFADDVSIRSAFIFAFIYFAVAMPPLLILWRRAHRVSFQLPAVEAPLPAPEPAG